MWILSGLSVFGWVALSSIYHSPNVSAGIPLFVGALLFGLLALTEVPPRQRTSGLSAMLLLIGCTLACLFVDWGTRVGLIFVALAAVGNLTKKRALGRLPGAFTVTGVVILIQSAAIGLFTNFLSAIHGSRALSLLDVLLFRLIGVGASSAGETVFVPTVAGTLTVASSWDQFGLIFFLVTLAGTAAVIYLGREPGDRLSAFLRTFFLAAAYFTARRFLLLLVAMQLGDPSLFWHPGITIASLAPLFLIQWSMISLSGKTLARQVHASLQPRGVPRTIAFVATAALATFCLTGFFAFRPGGAYTEPVILFDEAHGEWESTTRPMDTEWYGKASVYNYDSMYQWMSLAHDTRRITTRITGPSLDGCGILIVKTPTVPYLESEIHAIVDFVRDGGGLLVIGDHTNVFGTTTVTNSLLSRFGFSLNSDATYDLATGDLSLHVPTSFPREPITSQMQALQFLTSCSIHAPWNSWPVIRGTELLAATVDYSTEDFFPVSAYGLNATFGAFIQAAALPYGHGRVLVFSDSTCLSNFSLHMDGYIDFLTGALDFLSHRNPAFPYRAVLLGVAVVCVALVAILIRSSGLAVLLLLAGVCTGWGGANLAARALHPEVSSSCAAEVKRVTVCVDLELSDAVISPLPIINGMDVPPSRRFEAFFVALQRIGLVPKMVTHSKNQGLPPTVHSYVVINPIGSVRKRDAERLAGYAINGGAKLVLIEDPRNSKSGLDTLLEPCGFAASSDGVNRSLVGATVDTLRVGPADFVSVSSASCGRGTIYLVSGRDSLSNASLGNLFAQPSDSQRELYDILYDVFERVGVSSDSPT